MKNKIISVSGVQPTNNLTLGNYLGAIQNFSKINSDEGYFFVADLHSLTLGPIKNLQENIRKTLSFYLASGLLNEKNAIFVQSQVSEHFIIKQYLSYFCSMSELSNQVQFKEKSLQKKAIPLSLFDYPVLMAGDIILYEPTIVPVGADQVQHLELTNFLIDKLNKELKLNFIKPKPYIDLNAPKIMSLQNPLKKMSKSDENHNGTIFLSDSPSQIKNKIKKAVTDDLASIEYNDLQLGLKNLINIFQSVSGKNVELILREYENSNYGTFKNNLADAVIAFLEPLQSEASKFENDTTYLNKILNDGKNKASQKASLTVDKIKSKLNL